MSDQPQSEPTPATNAPTSPNGNLASAAQPPMTVSSAALGTARRIVLGAREEATAAELSLLDPQLASLFRIGHDAARSEEPAAVYMIAHAGRELARGVVRALTTPGAPATVFTMDACPPDGERNRATIAEVLQTQPNHAVVSEWFRLNKLFSDSVHYRDPAPESLRVRSAYLEFSDLLFGRVAPYFTTHAELERLIAREAPDGDDMNSVRTLLTRHVQRQHFFTALSSAGWLDPLAAAGFFDAPPDVVLDQEGRELTQPWPEGQYLVRMAPIQPARVAELLRGVPSTNRNVTVWRTMAEAALAMPPESARTLVRLLSRALANTARPQFLSHTLVDLTTRLGVLGEPGAFELADALLWTANAPLDTVEGSSGPAGRAFGASRSTEWMLERIEVYDLERLCDDAVPAMMEQSPKRTLRLLTRKLERTMRLAEDTNTLARAADSSSRWCPDFTDRSHSSDVRTILAVALNAVAVSASSEDATAVWAELKDHGSDIFDRIRLNVLAVAGPSLREELDSLIGSDALLDPDYGAREAAALLRAQFSAASSAAKRLFRYALERGPDPDSMTAYLQWRAQNRDNVDTTPTVLEHAPTSDADHEITLDEDVRTVSEDWQRRRLRWFHDRLPPELSSLAARLGVTPSVPSAEEQALDEVGFYSGGVYTSAERSPVDVTTLVAMTDESVSDFIATWKPATEQFDGPSVRGLENTLQEFAKLDTDRALRIAGLAAARAAQDGRIAALVRGLGEAGEDVLKQPALMRRLAELGTSLAASTARSSVDEHSRTDGPRDESTQNGNRRETLRAICRILERASNENRLDGADSDSLWTFVDAVVRSPDTWLSARDGDFAAFEEVTIAAINTLGGDVADLLVSLALADYRRLELERKEAGRSDLQLRLTPILNHVLEQRGRVAVGAEMILGQFAPQLLLVTPEWMHAHLPRLFDHGAREPQRHPAWGGYITGSRVYAETFRVLRPWYINAASEAGLLSTANRRGVRSITEGLGLHMISAVLYGLSAVGDGDRLVEQTFSNLPVKDRAHAYWAIFRGWSDANSPPPPEVVARLTAFWRWRLDVLEAAAGSVAAGEDASREAAEADEADETEGLIWFLATPHIPARDAIQLGYRTVAFLQRHRRTSATMWERLGEIAREEPAASFTLTELLLQNALGESYAYLPFEQVSPALRAALTCDDATVRARATRAIHELGAKGYLEFGKLLTEQNAPTKSEPSPEKGG